MAPGPFALAAPLCVTLFSLAWYATPTAPLAEEGLKPEPCPAVECEDAVEAARVSFGLEGAALGCNASEVEEKSVEKAASTSYVWLAIGTLAGAFACGVDVTRRLVAGEKPIRPRYVVNGGRCGSARLGR